MSDVSCPYCGINQEINHDDGYGYEDGEIFEQSCVGCDKEFKFTTSVMYHYETMCQDGDHDIESHTRDYKGGVYKHTSCTKCDFSDCEKLS